MPGRHQNASYFREGTRADAMITPAYTFTARLLHWTTAVLILSMIPLGVVIANEWGDQRRTLSTTCTVRSGRRSFPSSFCESSIVGRIRHDRYPMTFRRSKNSPRTPRTGDSTRFSSYSRSRDGSPLRPIARPSSSSVYSSCRRSGVRAAHSPSSFSSSMASSASPLPALWLLISARRSIITSCAGIASSCA